MTATDAKKDDNGKKDDHGKNDDHGKEGKTFPEMVGTALMYLLVLAVGLWIAGPILEFIADAFEAIRIALIHALSRGLGLSQKALQIVALVVISAAIGMGMIKLLKKFFKFLGSDD